ncbi:MAG: ABC transporter permease [Methylococcales bacterium]|nr:ABC transporter permease [Methylococcales bacterium]
MNNSIAFKTLLFKEIRRFMRIWPQTLLPPAITTALYFLIFGKLMGDRIGTVNGASYMEYIVPGIILMSVISHSYSNVVSSFYSTKFQHHIEELLVAPVSNSVILAGYIGGGIVRGLVVGVVVTAISMLFTLIPFQHIGIAVAIVLLTACLFSLAGFINAVFADSFDDISLIPNFILTPLSYLGGVFYSVAMLPPIWQTLSLGNPGLIGVTDIDIRIAFAMTIGFIVVLTLLSLYCLHKGIGIKN